MTLKEEEEEEEEEEEVLKCYCGACCPNDFKNMRMILCSICGNKRCPHAENHKYKCTNSNDLNQ